MFTGIVECCGEVIAVEPVETGVRLTISIGIMSLTLGKEKPAPIQEKVYLQPGAFVVVGLFLCTIATAVSLAT
ncbi:MAG: hypothetical protein ACKJSG_07960 [Lentisphaeria bacterium]|tara:strand:- start:63 stop:281 length:219 start_codon:yes stop_codon:yes gene_type:complete